MNLTERTHLWILSRECVGCNKCEVACEHRHGVKRLERSSPAFPVAVPEVCQHCPAPTCVEACISGALSRDPDTGLVTLDREQCVGCWSCIMVCPYLALRQDERDKPVSTKCDRCEEFGGPACVGSCMTGAMRCGDDAVMGLDLARGDIWITSLVRAAVCLFAVLAALMVGCRAPDWLAARYHALGVAAGCLMALTFVLPFVGRRLWRFAKQSVWTRAHMTIGVLATAGAMMHAIGRFGSNVQTFGATALGLLVVTGVAYRYLRPLSLMLAALLHRQAAFMDHEGTWEGADDGSHSRLQATVAAGRAAQAWAKATQRLDAVLESLRTAHVVLAVAAAGLIIAHVVVMTMVAGPQ